MENVEMIPGREWAYPLDDKQFRIEFQRRYPRCDGIPVKDEWLSSPPRESQSIDVHQPFFKVEVSTTNMDTGSPVEPIDKKPVFDRVTVITQKCEGCGREIASRHAIAMIAHKKKCKSLLDRR